jgi:hypothetical protein
MTRSGCGVEQLAQAIVRRGGRRGPTFAADLVPAGRALIVRRHGRCRGSRGLIGPLAFSAAEHCDAEDSGTE